MLLSKTSAFLAQWKQPTLKVFVSRFFSAALLVGGGFLPGNVNQFGKAFGVGCSPVIAVIIVLSVAMKKIIPMDIERQKIKAKLDGVIHKLAILENAMEFSDIVKATFKRPSKYTLYNLRLK